MPGRTRTRPMPRGDGARTGWSPTRPRAGGGVDVRAAAGRAQHRPDHPRFERCWDPVPLRRGPQAGTRTGAGRRGRCTSRRSSRTLGIPGGRYGTGSLPTPISSTRPTPDLDIVRCSGGTCLQGGSAPAWPAHPAIVSEAAYIAAQDASAAPRPRQARRHAAICWRGCCAPKPGCITPLDTELDDLRPPGCCVLNATTSPEP